MGFFGELLRMAPQGIAAYSAGQTAGQRERENEQQRRSDRKARRRKEELELALLTLDLKGKQKGPKPWSPDTDPTLLRERQRKQEGLGSYAPTPAKTFDPQTDPELARERARREEGLGVYRPGADRGDNLMDQSRVQDMQDQRIRRAQAVVQNLADAGQPYAEAALHPDVRGVMTPDEIRGVYEGQKRNIAAAGLRQENTQSVMDKRVAGSGNAFLDQVAAEIEASREGGPAAQPAPSRMPGAAPQAQAQKPIEDRIAELKAQGVSKEEARAILVREGYPVR